MNNIPRALAVAFLAAASSLPLFSQGRSDVILVSINLENGKIQLSTPAIINERSGYNNQPSFLPDGSGVLYSSADGPQTDIFLYTIGDKTNSRLASTPDSEYSPLVTPSGGEYSVIQLVLADGPRKGAQPLIAFPLTGGGSRLLYEEGKKIGYHAWIDGDRFIAFVLGEPHTLQLINLKSGEAKVLAENIGRALHKNPASPDEIFFSREGMIIKMNLETGAAEDVAALKGGDFFCPMPDGGLMTASGPEIFLRRPGTDAAWTKIGDFTPTGIVSISRLAVDPGGRWLAFVSNL